MTDEEWNQIQSLVPKPKSGKGKRGRPAHLDRRTLLKAIVYVVRAGCAWRLLPKDFGPWQTVYGCSRQWRIGPGLNLDLHSRRSARLAAQLKPEGGAQGSDH